MTSFARRSALAVLLTTIVTACGDDLPTSPISALQIIDVQVGTGAEAVNGKTLSVHYTGYLYSEAAPDHRGTRFDSSVLRNQPYSFVLGTGYVIEGWDRGITGMKVGGKRTLIIPPELAYGQSANGPIPANAALLFDIELLDVR
jgi:FKBP-type peptidyl-prolyl cis-trans isomerase FkpA